MDVKVTLHAGLANGGKTIETKVCIDRNSCTPADIIAALELDLDTVGLIFINDLLYKDGIEIFDGDHVALLPHMEGG